MQRGLLLQVQLGHMSIVLVAQPYQQGHISIKVGIEMFIVGEAITQR